MLKRVEKGSGAREYHHRVLSGILIATGSGLLLLLKLRPARVQRVHFASGLSPFPREHCSRRGPSLAIAGSSAVEPASSRSTSSASATRCSMLANSRASRYESFFLRRRRCCRRVCSAGSYTRAGLRSRLLAFRLPDLPLRVVGKTLGTALSIQAKHDGRNSIEHVTIMRHQHERAAKLEQALLQNF